MDNANEISADFTHKEVALFLGDDLKNQDNEAVVTYDLEEEYAKTAKHKNPFVWILLAACFFIVGAGTFTTIGLVSHSNHKITINIDSFDDLNLRSLLSSAGRVQNLYENALKNKESLIQNRDEELRQAEQKREMDLFTLQSVSTVATKDSIADRKAKIELDYNTTVQSINNSYDAEIANADEEINKIKTALDSYDATKLSEAQSAESSLDSTKQLHDMQMKNQSDKYEKKIHELRSQLLAQQLKAAEDQKNAVEEVRSIYQAKIDLLDPKAREESREQNKIILDVGIKNSLASSTLWKSVENLDFKESDFTDENSSNAFAESVKKAKDELQELKTIAYRFKPIPMENSIKDYVPAMMHQSYEIASELAKSGEKLQNEVNSLKTEAAVKDSFIDEYLSEISCDGIVESTENSPNFTVYVAKMSRIKVGEGSPVQILSGNKHVSDGTIAQNGEGFVVTQTIAEGSPAQNVYQVQVGDRIRIILKK